MNIIGQIKVNGEWVNQDAIPKEVVRKRILKSICDGMKANRFYLDEPEEKTA